jgi:hypothetical protein
LSVHHQSLAGQGLYGLAQLYQQAERISPRNRPGPDHPIGHHAGDHYEGTPQHAGGWLKVSVPNRGSGQAVVRRDKQDAWRFYRFISNADMAQALGSIRAGVSEEGVELHGLVSRGATVPWQLVDRKLWQFKRMNVSSA